MKPPTVQKIVLVMNGRYNKAWSDLMLYARSRDETSATIDALSISFQSTPASYLDVEHKSKWGHIHKISAFKKPDRNVFPIL